MVLKVIHHLEVDLVGGRWVHILLLTSIARLHSHCALLSFKRLNVAKSGELDPVGDRCPLKVEHGVDGLDFNPPASLLERVPNKPRIISVADNEFETVFDVGVLKGDLARSSLEHISVLPLALVVRRHLLRLGCVLKGQHLLREDLLLLGLHQLEGVAHSVHVCLLKL